jgi:hypothetical protein
MLNEHPVFCPGHFDPQLCSNVRNAERVLIERGHAEEYGRALIRELNLYPLGSDEDAALCATAPLDARLRAMAAVIRGLEKKETT